MELLTCLHTSCLCVSARQRLLSLFLVLGSNVPGEKREMWISEEQTCSHKAENSGVWQSHGLEWWLQLNRTLNTFKVDHELHRGSKKKVTGKDKTVHDYIFRNLQSVWLGLGWYWNNFILNSIEQRKDIYNLKHSSEQLHESVECKLLCFWHVMWSNI